MRLRISADTSFARHALLIRLVARVHDKSPADCALAWRMLMVILRRKRLIVVYRSLSTAADAQIDAGKERNLSRLMIPIEFVRARAGDIALILV
jgi:hypothetical protein